MLIASGTIFLSACPAPANAADASQKDSEMDKESINERDMVRSCALGACMDILEWWQELVQECCASDDPTDYKWHELIGTHNELIDVNSRMMYIDGSLPDRLPHSTSSRKGVHIDVLSIRCHMLLTLMTALDPVMKHPCLSTLYHQNCLKWLQPYSSTS